jgi:RNA polymerase-binding transcription factor DksA
MKTPLNRLPINQLGRIKALLLHQQRKVEQDLRALEEEDPVMDKGLAESSEPGTDSWLADTHSRVVAMRQNLLEMLTKTKKALINLRTGKYGKCDNCGKKIEEARLKAMPTATLCISCSKKLAKK